MARIFALVAFAALASSSLWLGQARAQHSRPARPLNAPTVEPYDRGAARRPRVFAGRLRDESAKRTASQRPSTLASWLIAPPNSWTFPDYNRTSRIDHEAETRQPTPEPEVDDNPRIVEDAIDVHNEDPSDAPNVDLAVNPNQDEEGGPSPNREPRGGAGLPHRDRIREALNWLHEHQCQDGHWSASEFGASSTRTGALRTGNREFVAVGNPSADGGLSPCSDLAATALALELFTCAGFDHKEGEFRECCRLGLMYLRSIQDNAGRFGADSDDSFLPAHALCATAVTEMYGISGDAGLKATCDHALKWLLSRQLESGGWARCNGALGRDGIADTFTTAWYARAIKSACLAGLEFDREHVREGILRFLDTVTVGTEDDVCTLARVGGDESIDTRFGGCGLPTLDAMNCLCRAWFDNREPSPNPTTQHLMKGCLACQPKWEDGQVDYLHWYWTSNAAYLVCTDYQKEWDPAVSTALLDHQRGSEMAEPQSTPETLDEFGSWDSVDPYSRLGGRVYSTAMAGLNSTLHYRYKRLHKG